MENHEVKFETIQTQNGGYISAVGHQSNEIGKLTFTIVPETQTMVISYVMVFPKYEGKGYGKVLVMEAVQYARKHKYSIQPHCSFSKSVLDRMKEEVKDVYL